MSQKEILMLGNEILRKKSVPVDFAKDPVEQYIHDLRDTLYYIQKEKKIGRAIAGPQIGYLKRIIYMETEDNQITMINPQIIKKSRKTIEVWDSCFSADLAFFGRTLRHRVITVKYMNENQEPLCEEFTDDLSELFQHEIDHLDGVLFTDHIIDNQIIMRDEWDRLQRLSVPSDKEPEPVQDIPTIESERLILRPFVPDDAAEVQRLAGNRAIADTTLNIPHPYRDGMAEKWISGHQDYFLLGHGVTFAVTGKQEGSLIGAISLMGMTVKHQAELGYWLGKPYWNMGFCTEAGKAMLKFAFSELGLVRVHASYLSRNPASGRVMEKLGMKHEGTRRQHVRKWDKLEDIELYGILKEEWGKTGNM